MRNNRPEMDRLRAVAMIHAHLGFSWRAVGWPFATGLSEQLRPDGGQLARCRTRDSRLRLVDRIEP